MSLVGAGLWRRGRGAGGGERRNLRPISAAWLQTLFFPLSPIPHFLPLFFPPKSYFYTHLLACGIWCMKTVKNAPSFVRHQTNWGWEGHEVTSGMH